MGVFEPFDHITAEEDLDELHRLCQKAMEEVECNYDGARDAVEVGTWVGSSALVLAEHFTKVFCVDHWEGNPGDRIGEIAQRHGHDELISAFCRNMESRLFRTVFPVYGHSDFWAAAWPRPVALVFIDGDHRYDQVKSDILLWKRSVAPGGCLAGHDYGTFPDVTRAVNELIPPRELRVVGNVWSTTIR